MKKRGLFILRIADPCTEDWSRMSAVEGGRHCERCNKAVIDLRGKSDEEILRLVSTSPHSVCVRVERFRVNTPLSMPQPLKPWPTAAAVLAGLTLACATPARAEEMPVVPAQFAPQATSDESRGDESRAEVTDTLGPTVIYGRVVTSVDGETLPGVEVVVKGTKLQTTTDTQGRYRLDIGPAWKTMQHITLQVQLEGFESAEILVDRSSAEQKIVRLEMAEILMGGPMIGTTRAPLYKRLWWKLQDVFTRHAQP